MRARKKRPVRRQSLQHRSVCSTSRRLTSHFVQRLSRSIHLPSPYVSWTGILSDCDICLLMESCDSGPGLSLVCKAKTRATKHDACALLRGVQTAALTPLVLHKLIKFIQEDNSIILSCLSRTLLNLFRICLQSEKPLTHIHGRRTLK